MPSSQPLSDPAAIEAADPPDGEQHPVEAPTPKKNRKRKVVLIAVLVPLALIAAAAYYAHYTSSKVSRVDAFSTVPATSRPQKAVRAEKAMNFLLLGSDSRNPENTDGSRSDTIIVLHLNKQRSAAQLISIPRDTWVHIPKSADGEHGNVYAKINAAYAWGGLPLMVQTVENYTGVRLDHVVMVDFAGFRNIVDALGGVTIDVPAAFTSTHSLNANRIRHFDKGVQAMNGAAALDFARERYAFRDGDFQRIRDQQVVIKAIIDKAASAGTLSNPGTLNGFLTATADSVTVDKTLNIFTTAAQLRHLRGGDLHYFTSPIKGTGMIGDQSVVLPDTAKARKLFAAVRDDDENAINSFALD